MVLRLELLAYRIADKSVLCKHQDNWQGYHHRMAVHSLGDSRFAIIMHGAADIALLDALSYNCHLRTISRLKKQEFLFRSKSVNDSLPHASSVKSLLSGFVPLR